MRDGRWPVVWSAGCALLVMCLSACSIGPRNFENENDRLRRENLTLKRQVEQLQTEVEAMDAALAAAEQRNTNGAKTLPEDVRRPVPVRIKLGRFSGPVDQNGDGQAELLRLYLQTLDTQDRFVQAIGRLKVSASRLTPGQPARTILTAPVSAAAFDAAYRSSAAGTHYTIELPVPEGVSCPMNQPIHLAIELEDLIHGHRLQQAAVVNRR
jgi:outer membrane murein-binding lipoprotein Lpp